MLIRALAVLALVGVLLPRGGDTRQPDRIELVNGTRLEGRIVFEDADTLVLRSGSREREVLRKDVKLAISRAARQRAALMRWIGLAEKDREGVLTLAQACKQEDLLEEMRLFALQALVLDPHCKPAHELLGHEQGRQGWMVPDGGSKLEWSRLQGARSDFGTPWELESTHYRVRTNLPLPRALEAAFALECHYHAFQDALGRDLRLHEVLEPLHASIHADTKSYPEIATGRNAYFVPETRTLHVNASQRLDMRALLHEATHAMIHGTSTADGTGRASIPAWLDEGLAVYMESALVGPPGRMLYDHPKEGPDWYKVHAAAESPYDLSRLLNFEAGDFLASTHAHLKYAQAFTLVDFLLHGDNGKHREGFARFMQGAYRGKSSQTHFKDALRVSDKALERAWTEHVRTLAR